MSRPELLAPAGGMRELRAAVQSGADAVYLGAADFSARAGAKNFDYDELSEAVEYCHIYGVKVHCALNTLIKESELAPAVEAAKRIYQCGVDALIIQDIGLAAHLKKILPDIDLHASTQMTVTSLEGVKYLEEHGFSRVVLARELNMCEIAAIVKSAKAEIEVFVHGAICMCYSGQCLMSSILGGRSGNRGRCAQPCRLKYDLQKDGAEIDSAYALSPKDMALADNLDKLIKIGVSSLKIEGRLKSAEYVSAVVGIYRKYLDHPTKVSTEDMAELKAAFSRSGFTDGYFTGKLGKSMMAHDNPANNSENAFTPAAKARAAGEVTRRIPISVFASLSAGDVLRVAAYDGDSNFVSLEGDAKAEPADGRPITRDRIAAQLAKLGATPFYAADINVEADEGTVIPIRDINAVRRRMCRELIRLRAQLNRVPPIDAPIHTGNAHNSGELYLTAEVTTLEQGLAVINAGGVRRIFAPARIAAELLGGSAEIVTKTADIFSPENIATDSVSVSSPAALLYYGKKAKYGDFRLNIYNSLTIGELKDLKCVTLSPELNLREITEVTAHAGDVETEIIGYGHIPLMIMKNCPLKALGKCSRKTAGYCLRDRKGISFPLICQNTENGGCRSVLLNSKPIFVADMLENIKKTKINCIRLNFTVENSEQCGKILSMYKEALNGRRAAAPDQNTFTRAHLKRGVL